MCNFFDGKKELYCTWQLMESLITSVKNTEKKKKEPAKNRTE